MQGETKGQRMTTKELRSRTTVTIEEAAKVLGIGRGTAYEAAARGELPGALRLGGRWVVATAPLLRAIGADNAEGTGAA